MLSFQVEKSGLFSLTDIISFNCSILSIPRIIFEISLFSETKFIQASNAEILFLLSQL